MFQPGGILQFPAKIVDPSLLRLQLVAEVVQLPPGVLDTPADRVAGHRGFGDLGVECRLADLERVDPIGQLSEAEPTLREPIAQVLFLLPHPAAAEFRRVQLLPDQSVSFRFLISPVLEVCQFDARSRF